MLTEKRLPNLVLNIDYKGGTADVVVRTEIRRDDVVIHTILDHQTIDIGDMGNALEPLNEAIDEALKDKVERDKAAQKNIPLGATI